jgi:hypothetical protein
VETSAGDCGRKTELRSFRPLFHRHGATYSSEKVTARAYGKSFKRLASFWCDMEAYSLKAFNGYSNVQWLEGSSFPQCTKSSNHGDDASVRFSSPSTTGEYNFIYSPAEQRGNLQSSLVECLPRRAASPVAARRIAVWLLERHLACTYRQEDPCGKIDGRIVHACRNQVR